MVDSPPRKGDNEGQRVQLCSLTRCRVSIRPGPLRRRLLVASSHSALRHGRRRERTDPLFWLWQQRVDGPDEQALSREQIHCNCSAARLVRSLNVGDHPLIYLIGVGSLIKGVTQMSFLPRETMYSVSYTSSIPQTRRLWTSTKKFLVSTRRGPYQSS